MNGKAAPLIGMIAMGFGILLIWSAYTKKPLFGDKGLIPTFIRTGSLGDAAQAAGSAVGQSLGEGLFQRHVKGADIPMPPGAGEVPPGAVTGGQALEA